MDTRTASQPCLQVPSSPAIAVMAVWAVCAVVAAAATSPVIVVAQQLPEGATGIERDCPNDIGLTRPGSAASVEGEATGAPGNGYAAGWGASDGLGGIFGKVAVPE